MQPLLCAAVSTRTSIFPQHVLVSHTELAAGLSPLNPVVTVAHFLSFDSQN